MGLGGEQNYLEKESESEGKRVIREACITVTEELA